MDNRPIAHGLPREGSGAPRVRAARRGLAALLVLVGAVQAQEAPIPLTGAVYDTASFEGLKSAFEGLLDRRYRPTGEVNLGTLAEHIMLLDGGKGEDFLTARFPELDERARSKLAPIVGHFGRKLDTFLMVVHEAAHATGHFQIQMTSSASLIASRMKDDETWQDAVAFELSSLDEEIAARAAFYIAQAGGPVADVLLRDAMISGRATQTAAILRQIPGRQIDAATMDKVAALLLDDEQHIATRRATVFALRRCGRQALPHLVRALESLEDAEDSELVGLRELIHGTLVKLVDGVDFGKKAKSWARAIADDPLVEIDASEPVRKPQFTEAADPIPAAILAIGFALMGLSILVVRRSVGGHFVVSPIAGLCVLIATVQTFDGGKEIPPPPATTLDGEVRLVLEERLWVYLNDSDAVRPSFAADRCTPQVRDGSAFSSFRQVASKAVDLEIVKIHGSMAKVYYHLDDETTLTARLRYRVVQGEAFVHSFEDGPTLTSRPTVEQPERPAVQVDRSRPEADEERVAIALALCAVAVGIVLLNFFLGTRIRPWERPAKLEVSATEEKTKVGLSAALKDVGQLLPTDGDEAAMLSPAEVETRKGLHRAFAEIQKRIVIDETGQREGNT